MESCEQGLNEETAKRHLANNFLLRLELSVQEKFSCCLPLRPGFLLLACLKLVLNVGLFFGILHFLILMYIILPIDEIFTHIVVWASICIDVVDIVIGVVIILGTYQKNQRLMEMYYKYSIYIFVLLSFLCCLLFHFMYLNIYSLLIFIILFILLILMQVYLSKVVKSEVLKLKSMTQFQILNNDQEPLCRYVNNIEN